MTQPQLHALLVDHHLGELPEEVSALLEAYLAHDATARAESVRIAETLGIARQAVVAHPELVSPASQAPATATPIMKAATTVRRQISPWLKLAAALALAALTGFGGYMAGGRQAVLEARSSDAPPQAKPVLLASAEAEPGRKGPWAQYRVERPGQGTGLQITRIPGAARE